jgi:hypothetical protein
MSQGGRFQYAALGLVAGVGLATLFLVWAVPGFRDPMFAKKYYEEWQPYGAGGQAQQPNDEHFWVRELYGLAYAEDSLAQWLMAVLAGTATVFTVIAVRWARRAVTTNQAQVRAYFKVADIKWEWQNVPFNQGLRITAVWENCGNSPARNCVFMRDFAIVNADLAEDLIPDFEQWDRRGAIPMTVSVGQRWPTEVCTISGDDIEPVIQDRSRLVIYLAVEYTDVFDHTFVDEICQVGYFPNPRNPKKIRVRGLPPSQRLSADTLRRPTPLAPTRANP